MINLVTAEDLTSILSRLAALEANSGGGISGDAGGPVAPFIWHANSGDASERVTELKLNKRSDGGTYMHVIYSIPLPDMQPGDLLQAYATFEVTNDSRFDPVMVGRFITMHASENGYTGINISEAATRNVTKGMHHDHIQDFGSYVVVNPLSGLRLNLVAYTANPTAVEGDIIRVEQDYGRLFVTITRAGALETA